MPKPSKLHGTKNITVTAEIENEGQRSEGEAKAKMKVTDARTFLEKWGIPVFLIALFLFILFGWFICKKWLPRKTYYTYGTGAYKGVAALKWYSNANILSVILPFIAVRSSVRLKLAVPGVTLKVKARGGTSVYVSNADSITDDSGNKMHFNGGEIHNKAFVSLAQTEITTASGKFVAGLQTTSRKNSDFY